MRRSTGGDWRQTKKTHTLNHYAKAKDRSLTVNIYSILLNVYWLHTSGPKLKGATQNKGNTRSLELITNYR